MPTNPRPPEFDSGDLTPAPLAGGPHTISAVALDVSGTCNLACRYCAEAASLPQRRPMSKERLEEIWHLLFPNGLPKAGSSIRLGSGEPLLAFPLLRDLADLIERSGGCAAEGRPYVFLTTNGTLAGAKVRDWLVASGWRVKVSLDGPAAVHNKWRVNRGGRGTFDRVADAVAELARRMPERFSVTAVLCRGADAEEVFGAIAGLGVQRIELVPVAHGDESIIPGNCDVARYERFLRGYVRRMLQGEADLPSLVRFETCVRRAMGYDLQQVPCGAGRSFVAAGPDGDLYPCFRFLGLTRYRIGRLPAGVDVDVADAFQRTAGRPWNQRVPCSQCWAAPLCGGPCFACCEVFGPGDGQPIPLHCAYMRADARAAIRLVERLSEEAPERLLGFLPGCAAAFAALT